MSYDYIVVGGGSSGSLVAGRLAEAGARVLVLEAGGSDKNPLIQMPAGFVKLLGVEKYMWFYKSTIQKQLDGRAPVIPQGKVIGGGSSVNAMFYIRGQAGDYTPWVEATGDSGWSWPEVLKRYRDMEDNNRLQNEAHGVGGPWAVSDPTHIDEVSRRYVLAAQEAGIPFTPDFNSGVQRGVGFPQVNMRNRRRWSAADAFLKRPCLPGGWRCSRGA